MNLIEAHNKNYLFIIYNDVNKISLSLPRG